MSLGQVSARCAETPQTHCLSAPMLSMLASPMATSSCVLSWLYCTTPTRDSPASNCWKKQKPVRVRNLRGPWRAQKSRWWFVLNAFMAGSADSPLPYSRQKEPQQEWMHMGTNSVSQSVKKDRNPGLLAQRSQHKPLAMVGGQEWIFFQNFWFSSNTVVLLPSSSLSASHRLFASQRHPCTLTQVSNGRSWWLYSPRATDVSGYTLRKDWIPNIPSKSER